jgi:hypothetical protein
MRKGFKADVAEKKRYSKWENILIESGKGTNRNIPFGESDRSAPFYGHRSKKR